MELWLIKEPSKGGGVSKVQVGDTVRLSKAKNVFEKRAIYPAGLRKYLPCQR